MTILRMIHGLPGSGKSTFAATMGLPIVNRDTIRTEMFGGDYHRGSFPKASERRVQAEQTARLRQYLSTGQSVVCDDTNLGLRTVERLASLAHEYGASVEHHHLDVPVSVCKQQNTQRERVVPEHVIDQMATMAYTHDGLHLRRIDTKFGRTRKGGPKMFAWRARDLSHPHERTVADFNAERPSTSGPAVVFDMDGTLVDVSELVERYMLGPKRDFDAFHRESEFSPANQWVVDATHKTHAEGLQVLVVTARQSTYAEPTIAWLRAHGVPVDKLYMRAHDDMRPDYWVKRDIATDIELDGYTITHAYDDNPQVLDLWRELDIPVTVVPNEQWRQQ